MLSRVLELGPHFYFTFKFRLLRGVKDERSLSEVGAKVAWRAVASVMGVSGDWRNAHLSGRSISLLSGYLGKRIPRKA